MEQLGFDLVMLVLSFNIAALALIFLPILGIVGYLAIQTLIEVLKDE